MAFEAPPAPRQSGRHGGRARRGLIAGGVAIAVALAATGAWVITQHGSPAHAGRNAAESGLTSVALPAFAPPAGTDGTDESLESVASSGRTFVTVGSSESGGRSQPLLLRSTDLGRTWTNGTISGDATVEDRPSRVAGGARGWVALGRASRGFAAWTSPDGASWHRRSLDQKVFGVDDTVERVRAVADGFLAVGYYNPDIAASTVVLWDSRDGVTWHRRTAQQLGIAPQRRGSYGNDVAQRGSTVIVGAGEYDQTAEIKNSIAFYVSTDGGAHFRRAPTALTLGNGGGSRCYIAAVLPTANGWTAIGNGGNSSYDGYDAFVATSPDGLRWRDEVEFGLDLPGDDHLLDGALVQGRVLGVGDSDEDGFVVGDTGSIWRQEERDTLALNGAGPQRMQSVAAIGDVIVSVGSDTGTGDSDALLVRRQGLGAMTAIRLPEVDRLAKLTASVSDVVATSDGVVAVGSSAGGSGLWRSTDGAKWQRLDQQGDLLGGEGDQTLYAAAGRPDSPSVVAAGTTTGASASSAMVLDSNDGRTFAASSSTSFNGPNQYADRVLTGAATNAKVTVLVGWSDEGAVEVSAFPVWSADGKAFVPGTAAKPGHAALDDLVGKPYRARVMASVAAGPAGFLAVGSVGIGPDRGDVPAAWTSTDGKVWALAQLPTPAGYDGAVMEHVTSTGRGWAATGHALHGIDDVPMVWTSADGSHWLAAQPLPLPAGRHGRGHRILSTPSGLVVVGSTTDEDGDDDAAVWRASGASQWSAVSVGGVARGRGQQSFHAATVRGGKVLVLGSAVTTDGVRTLIYRLAA